MKTLSGLFKDGSLKARVLRGSFLTLLMFGTQNAFRLISSLILTRLLFPEAFGLMALVFMVQTGVTMMADLGTRVSVIQHKEGNSPDFLDTVWVLQIVRGFVIAGLIWVTAEPIAGFYEHEILAEILAYIAIATIAQGFLSTKIPQAERNLELGQVATLHILSQVIGLVANVVLAIWLQSVWALVYGYMINEVVRVALSHLMLRGHANRFVVNRGYAREIINFGAFIFLSSMAGFLIAQGDRAILGKIATLEELALYNIGFMFASVPLLLVRALTDRILFPLYAQRPPWKDPADRAKIFKVRRIITAGCIAGLIVLAFSGVWLVTSLYDPRFEGAGAFVVLVAVGLMPAVILASYAPLALAAGESRRFALVTIGAAVTQMVVMLLLGVAMGIVGVIAGLAVAPVLFYPAMLFLLRRYRGWDPLHDAVFALIMVICTAVVYRQGVFDGLIQG